MIKFDTEPPNGFYTTLRQRGEKHLAAAPKTAQNFLFAKAIFLVAAYFFCFYKVIFGENLWFWYALMGFFTVPMILNIGHEAVHNAFSKNARLNLFCAQVFNLVGASGHIWRERHVKSHHVLPNIYGHDSDIAQNKLARIAPATPHIPAHRFQHFYMPGLYLIYTLNWLIYRDFKDARRFFGSPKSAPRQWAALIFTKIFYFGHALFLPIFVRPEAWTTVFLGFILMQFVLSTTTFLVLVSAHVSEDAVFPEPDFEGKIHHSWAAHQLITTTDFAPENWLVTHLFGGFNHHAVHHLFPQISHVHYPGLTKIVRQTASEFGLPYHCFSSIPEAVFSHFRFLKKNAAVPVFDEI